MLHMAFLLIKALGFLWVILCVAILLWVLFDWIRLKWIITRPGTGFVKFGDDYMCMQCGRNVQKKDILWHKCGRRPE